MLAGSNDAGEAAGFILDAAKVHERLVGQGWAIFPRKPRTGPRPQSLVENPPIWTKKMSNSGGIQQKGHAALTC